MRLPDYLDDYSRARIKVQHDGCWRWTGPVNKKGYGVANLPGNTRTGAHRHIVRLSGRDLAHGEPLDHQCHNRDQGCPGGPTCLHRRCVNPAHLNNTTVGQNSCNGKGAPALNLSKETCLAGHEYDYTYSNGWRKCTKCDLAQAKARRAMLRAPCRNCGGPVGSGRSYKYCEQCRTERSMDNPVKPKARGGFNTAVKLKCRKRAGDGDEFDATCEACGCWLGRYGGQVQHRDARGIGGSKDPVTNGLSNALLLCGTAYEGCHGLCEKRNRRMQDMGYWLEHGQDPRLTPVRLHGGREVWLTEDGRYSTEPPGLEAVA